MRIRLRKQRPKFCEGDEVLVERRKYGDRRSVHRGIVRALRQSDAVVYFPGRKSKQTEVLAYERLKHVPAEMAHVDPSTWNGLAPASVELQESEPAIVTVAVMSAPAEPPANEVAFVSQTVQTVHAVDVACAWTDVSASVAEGLRSRVRLLRGEAQEYANLFDARMAEAELIEAKLAEIERFSKVWS